MTLPSYAEIMEGRVSRRNWRKSECAQWGITYPPPAGFPNRLYPQTSDLGMLIPCTRGLAALVDPQDYDRLADFYWVAMNGGRPGRAGYFQPIRQLPGKVGVISMGREILQPEDGFEVDHINGDPFDNRRSNLRLCTHAQNVANRRKFTGCSSGFKGVIRHGNRWRSVIHCNGIRKDIGSFATQEEAARAYDKFARQMHGEFALLNFSEAA
jgi:hypothetical protein